MMAQELLKNECYKGKLKRGSSSSGIRGRGWCCFTSASNQRWCGIATEAQPRLNLHQGKGKAPYLRTEKIILSKTKILFMLAASQMLCLFWRERLCPCHLSPPALQVQRHKAQQSHSSMGWSMTKGSPGEGHWVRGLSEWGSAGLCHSGRNF